MEGGWGGGGGGVGGDGGGDGGTEGGGVQGSFVSCLSSLDVPTEAAYGFLISHKPASLSTSRLHKSLLADTFLPFH